MDRKGFLVANAFLVATLFLWRASPVSAVPLSLTKDQDLAFGSFIRQSVGTVTVDPSGVRQVSGGVYPLATAAFSAARFTIRGNGGASYSLTLPSSFTLTLNSSTMTVNALTASVPLAGALPSAGSLSFTVGGTLTVGAAQESGTHIGTLTVSVNK